MSGERAGARSVGARNLVTEFLGAFVRRLDDWFPVAPLVSLMSDVGMDEASVRVAVSRLKTRGWLEPERRDGLNGYRLTAIAHELLAEGDAFIYSERRSADVDAGWALVAFSVPEHNRSKRHALKSRLVAAGFGHTGPGLLIAPVGMLPEARRIINDLELSEYTELFTAHYEGREVSDLVGRGWDLPALSARYEQFLQAADAIIRRDQPGVSTGARALADYLSLLHEWRLVAYSDPGLPAHLLGEGWRGGYARQVFDAEVARLDPVALDHVRAGLAAEA